MKRSDVDPRAKFDPPEDAIEAAMKRAARDPRRLAIAYLRAVERAKRAEVMLKVAESHAAFCAALDAGDVLGMKTAIDTGVGALKRFAASRDEGAPVPEPTTEGAPDFLAEILNRKPD